MRLAAAALLLCAASVHAQREILVDVHHIAGPHTAMPLECVGAGRANEGLRADWQAQLATVQQEIGFHYLRFHGLLHDDMGVYSVGRDGKPVYNFQYVDALYDALLAHHIRPFVELSFMPGALASDRTKTVFWWKANVSPPNDPARWSELIRRLVQHFSERYGAGEIAQWYFEVWNEPDLSGFWSGTQAQYLDLYRDTAEAVKAVCPACRVGGPADASPPLEPVWLDYVQRNHVPADFLSSHTYAVTQGTFDATGEAGTVLDTRPGAIVGRVQASHDLLATHPGMQLHYTEWSTSYTPADPIHDQYISAPFILQKLHDSAGLAQSMSYWTFTDIFEEAGPRATPFHGGFGLLNYQGIRKPAYFAYRFLAQLGTEDLRNDDAQSWITRDEHGGVQALLWNYTAVAPPPGQTNQTFYSKEQPAASAPTAHLHLSGLAPGMYRVNLSRVGYTQNDAYTAYLRLGSPEQLTRSQQALLTAASSAPPVEVTVRIRAGDSFDRLIPMQQNSVVLLTVEPLERGKAGSRHR